MQLDKEMQAKYEKILAKYDNNYFADDMKELIKYVLVFVDMLELGNFTHDNGDTDYILWSIKKITTKDILTKEIEYWEKQLIELEKKRDIACDKKDLTMEERLELGNEISFLSGKIETVYTIITRLKERK